MAGDMKLGVVVGGVVSPTVGAAFNTVEGRVKRLQSVAGKSRVMQGVIAETMRLRDEWKKAHDTGAAGADTLRRKLEGNLSTLRRQGVEVRNLTRAYEAYGRTARSAEMKAKGIEQAKSGVDGLKKTGIAAAAATAAVVVPTKISADYNAIIRDIAIKAGIAGTDQESKMSKTIISTGRDNGLGRNEVADVVNALVGAGMDVSKAIEYAPVASKFVVGQGADATDTAKMINALGQNAKITDAGQMQKALEAIAYQGQAGSFEAADMAKWFPELLASMAKMGVTGNDAVSSLGAMLQVQMKTAGSSDEAANNLKNWIEKIGSGDVVKAYKDAGIDYQKSLQSGIAKGMSPLEASFSLAQKYVATTDPKRAKAMQEAYGKIDKETDPAKAKEMMNALEASLRTGDLFADMQVKAALTAYSQNKALYQQLKRDSGGASGILDKNLAERRDTSSQKWKEAGNAVDDSLRSIGDALRPITDVAADVLTKVAHGITDISDKSPGLAAGLVSAGAAIAVVLSAISTFKIGKGLINIGRGALGRGGAASKAASGAGDDAGGKAEGATEEAKPKSRGAAVSALVGAGVKAYSERKKTGDKKEADEAGDGDNDGKKGVVEAGLSVLESIIDSKEEKGGEAGDGGPQKVIVVNTSDFGLARGGAGAGVGDAGPGDADRGSRSSRRRRRRRGTGGRPPLPAPLPPVPPPVPPRVGLGARAMGLAGGASKLAGRIPGASLIEAGTGALEVYQNATTQDEKAEGYGSVAGNLAGGLAGAAAGAAIGSVVPIIGTAIGGLIGGMLGSFGGEAAGGYLGKMLFGDDKPPEAVADGTGVAPKVPTLAEMQAAYAGGDSAAGGGQAVSASQSLLSPGGPAPISLLAPPAPVAAAAPAKVEQTYQWSPQVHIQVQGDAKDPREMAQQLMPEIERTLRSLAQQNERRSMVDAPLT
jgi:TP901 family phage tail tape measure protein